ncbi:carboxylesterase family protein [Candidatus Bathyarchaeota archaeon]|nr:carboxylesterase family protein [Candidatus Bathyarchaeota archaeon]
MPQDSATITTPTSEDCLFINVFAPADATEDSKLPVWFFIQGGGYATNANANYNGTEVVDKSGKGLVMVNFNYRVGALGFLASEKIREDGALNVGLLDQRKALEWVQKNIKQVRSDLSVFRVASSGKLIIRLLLVRRRPRSRRHPRRLGGRRIRCLSPRGLRRPR